MTQDLSQGAFDRNLLNDGKTPGLCETGRNGERMNINLIVNA